MLWPLRGTGYSVAGVVMLLAYNYKVGNTNSCVVSEPRGEASIWGCGFGGQIDKTLNLAP